MRSVSLILSLVITSGCAAPTKTRQVTEGGDSPRKASFLQRMGFGHPVAQKNDPAKVQVSPADTQAVPATTDGQSEPTISIERMDSE